MAILKIHRNTQRCLSLVKTEYHVFLKGQHKCVNLGKIIISKSLFIAENIIFLMVIAKHHLYKDFEQKEYPSN